jgi:hypothetical protein
MKFSFVYRCGLSIAVVCLLFNTTIAPGTTQPTGTNDFYRVSPPELVQIKKAGKRVIRQQTKLTIKTQRRSIVFQDVGDAYQEGAITYHLESYFPDINYFLVSRSSYEDGDYTLINGQTGEKTILWAAPVFSPNRQRFASMTLDEMNGYTSVYIYRIDPSGVKVEYRDDGKKWKPTNPKWRSNSRIEFRHEAGNSKFTKVLLSRTGQSWRASINPAKQSLVK